MDLLYANKRLAVIPVVSIDVHVYVIIHGYLIETESIIFLIVSETS